MKARRRTVVCVCKDHVGGYNGNMYKIQTYETGRKLQSGVEVWSMVETVESEINNLKLATANAWMYAYKHHIDVAVVRHNDPVS